MSQTMKSILKDTNNTTRKRKHSETSPRNIKISEEEPKIYNLEPDNRKNEYIEEYKKAKIHICNSNPYMSHSLKYPCKRNNTIFFSKDEYIKWYNETKHEREKYRLSHPEGPFKSVDEYNQYLRKKMGINIMTKKEKQLMKRGLMPKSSPHTSPDNSPINSPDNSPINSPEGSPPGSPPRSPKKQEESMLTPPQKEKAKLHIDTNISNITPPIKIRTPPSEEIASRSRKKLFEVDNVEEENKQGGKKSNKSKFKNKNKKTTKQKKKTIKRKQKTMKQLKKKH